MIVVVIPLPPKGNNLKSFGSIILAIVLFVGIIWLKSLDRQRKSDDAVGQAIAVVESVPEYGKHQAFFDSKLARYHERAFEVAYSNTRRRSSFDERSYQIVLLSLFMDDAETEGNTEVYEAILRELREIQSQTP